MTYQNEEIELNVQEEKNIGYSFKNELELLNKLVHEKKGTMEEKFILNAILIDSVFVINVFDKEFDPKPLIEKWRLNFKIAVIDKMKLIDFLEITNEIKQLSFQAIELIKLKINEDDYLNEIDLTHVDGFIGIEKSD